HLAATKITEAARFYAKFTKVEIKGNPHYARYLFYYFASHLRIIPKISFLIDTSKEFKKKMKAVECYRSQFIDNPKNRVVFDYLDRQNGYLGKLIGADYAEALFSKKMFRIEDISVFA
ncbi:MAG: PIG-L deacetylase family protein, partial [Candidatus Omnitrophota bacterium]